MIIRAFIFAALLSLVVSLVSGCAGANSLKSKTVVIPDSEQTIGGGAAAGEDFEVRSIYRLPENGEVLGWIAKDRLLGTKWKTNRSRSLERIDYKNSSYDTWFDLNGTDDIVSLSPDGAYAISTLQKNGNETAVKLLQLTDPQPTEIGDISTDGLKLSSPAWSNNSRYISYNAGMPGQRGSTIFVYDVNARSSRKYTLPLANVTQVKVSNDGAAAIVVHFTERRYSLVYGKLEGHAFVSQYEHDISGDIDTVDFMNDDQIMFVGLNGSLLVYDRRNGSSTVVMEQIGGFRLAGDRKAILYTKGRDTLYAASLHGNNAMNEKAVYKGMIPFQFEWSPDNQKILLNGRKQSAPLPAVALAESMSAPLVLELK